MSRRPPLTYRTAFHLSLYTRRPLRLAISKSDLDYWWSFAESLGLAVRRISLWCRYPLYPDVVRRRRIERGVPGRLIIPRRFVEEYGLRACRHYVFCISLGYRVMKVKIRIYNEELSPESPTGMFQGFYLVTVPVDGRGMIIMDHPLTRELIEQAKRHFVSYWRGQPVPLERTLLIWMRGEEAYKDRRRVPVETDLPYAGSRARYLRSRGEEELGLTPRTYAKGLPPEFIEWAEKLTIRDLIVGVSAVVPTPAKMSELGVWWQESMIIKRVRGVPTIVWHDRRGAPLRIYPAVRLLHQFQERVRSMPDVVVEEG